MSKYVNLAAAAAVATMVSFGATSAQAATITAGGPVTDPPTSVTVECDGCRGFIHDDAPAIPNSTGDLSNTLADYFTINPQQEADLVNALAGTNFDLVNDGNKTEIDSIPNEDGESYSFFSDAAYILFKNGAVNGSFVLALTAPGVVELFYEANGTSGGGLSHYTEFGTSVIPLPAGLVLFLSGLAGIGVLGRYKAKRRETAII